jgi:hypothetical protein
MARTMPPAEPLHTDIRRAAPRSMGAPIHHPCRATRICWLGSDRPPPCRSARKQRSSKLAGPPDEVRVGFVGNPGIDAVSHPAVHCEYPLGSENPQPGRSAESCHRSSFHGANANQLQAKIITCIAPPMQLRTA